MTHAAAKSRVDRVCTVTLLTMVLLCFWLAFHSQHTGLAWLLPLGFAALVAGLLTYGWTQSLGILQNYAQEETYLAAGDSVSRLNGIANEEAQLSLKGVDAAGSLQKGEARQEIERRAPLLNDRLQESIYTLRRGSPLMAAELSNAENRRFPAAERRLRTLMDIVLNVGIAGTFLSIMLNISVNRADDIGALLSHVGPGLLSGMAAVLANVALRICHSVVLERQDTLTDQIDDRLNEHFLSKLPRWVTSPDERLARVMQATINEQTQNLHDLLLNRLMGPVTQIAAQSELLTRYTGDLAQHAGDLAQHSEKWEAAVVSLKDSQLEFVRVQRENAERYVGHIAGLFQQYAHIMEEFDARASARYAQSLKDMEQLFHDQQERQSRLSADATAELQRQFSSLLQGHLEESRREIDPILGRFETALREHSAEIDGRISETLQVFNQKLPDAVRESLQRAVADAVGLVDDLRAQAGALAHAVSQVSQQADRQVLAFQSGTERTVGWLQQLEQAAAARQQTQSEMMEQWRERAAESLGQIETAFARTSTALQEGGAHLESATQTLVVQSEALRAQLDAGRGSEPFREESHAETPLPISRPERPLPRGGGEV